jgi:hypothetical protein
MKRPQTTPGDWHLGKRAGADHGAIYGPKGEEIALPLGFFMEDDEAKANARAIAALPALLEALEFVSPWLHCEKGNPEGPHAQVVAALRLAGYEF